MSACTQHLSTPFGGWPALPPFPSFANNITKLAPVAAVGEMRWAVRAFVLRAAASALELVAGYGTEGRDFRQPSMHSDGKASSVRNKDLTSPLDRAHTRLSGVIRAWSRS